MSFELTVDDLFILEARRLERFQACFPDILKSCVIALNRSTQLVIHCTEPWHVDGLLERIDAVRQLAWVVLGARTLSICFVGEEIHKTSTKPSKRSRRSQRHLSAR